MASDLSSADLLTRREALRRVSLALGGITLIGESAWLAGPAQGATGVAVTLFSASEIALLDEIADTILPTTSTPGAKAAGVGPFIAVMVRDVYDAPQQKVFRSGLTTLQRRCRKVNGADFMACTPQQRQSFLEKLDREQFDERRSQLAIFRKIPLLGGDAKPFRVLRRFFQRHLRLQLPVLHQRQLHHAIPSFACYHRVPLFAVSKPRVKEFGVNRNRSQRTAPENGRFGGDDSYHRCGQPGPD